MADDTVDNEHPTFVIIADDTVNNEHPRVSASTLGDEAEGQQTNGSTVGSKKDVDSKDDIGETDAHGHQKTDKTDDGANIEDKNSETDIIEEDNRSPNEGVPFDQGNVQLSDNNCVKTEEKTDANRELRDEDNIGPNDIPKETRSVEQMVDYSGEKQRREIQDLKERLLHSVKGIEKLQNDFELLRNQLVESKRMGEDLVKKDIRNSEEICRLKELISNLQTRHANELVQTHNKLAEEKETQNKKHKKDLDEMRKKMESKIAKEDEEIKKTKTEIQKHKDEISKIIRENVMLKTVVKEEEKQFHATERQLDEAYQYQEKLRENFRSEIKEKDNQLQLLTYTFNQSLQDRDRFHQQVQVLTAEKKELLLRLSKVASAAEMTYNNPNIADLSYEKRPTKLAEEFSELYDCEWTDAFEEIEGENEKEKIRFVYELLMRANQVCVDLLNRHTRKVKQSIATLTLLMPNRQEQHWTGECLDKEKLRQGKQEQNLQGKVQAKDGSERQTEGECVEEKKGDMNESQKTRLESDFEKLQTEQKKTILEATKYFETLLSEDVKKAVTEVIVNEKGIDDEKQKCVVVYIEKCIDLCWSMLRHKPPVHVDFSDIISGTPFDTNKYKPYTKTGKHLAYIVWPALYLYEGGPLLSKGVAQGK